MRTPFLSGLAFALPLLALQTTVRVPATPAQPTTPSLFSSSDPRTPIDETNTPGDADSIFRIEEAGSYYLRGNVLGEAGKSAIEVAANDVTIDLMGFQLSGVTGSLSGIRLAQGGNGLRITDGIVRGFGGDGLELTGSRGVGIERVDVRSCVGVGMRLGDESSIADCQAVGNGQEGILAGDRTTVDHCLVASNAREGIELDDHAIVSECILRGNEREGLQTGLGAIVRGVVASENGGVGILTSEQAVVRECSTAGNGDDGIRIAGGMVVHSTAANNEGDGVGASGTASLLENLLFQNGGNGAQGAGQGATHIEGNFARLNGGRGLRTVGLDNFVVRNFAINNESGNYGLSLGFNGEVSFQPSVATPWANVGF